MQAKRSAIWRSFVLLALIIFASLSICVTNWGVREIRSEHHPIAAPPAEVDPSPDDWPCWRSQNHSNIAISSRPPLQWSDSENVEWHTAVPGRGHSSPCVWQNQILLTTSDDQQQRIFLLSFHRESGRPIWQTELHRGGYASIHLKNSHASSTVACDGNANYVACQISGAIWISAVDYRGQILWQTNVGPYSSEWGYGSSPAIYKSLLIVAGDNRGEGIDRIVGSSWMAALDRQTGQINWRIKRQDGDSFGTPIVGHVAGRDQLLLAGKDFVTSYNPVDGEQFWKCRWDIKRTANSMVFDHQCVYASGRFPQGEMVCIRADGSGDVSDTHVNWREKKSACDVPTPCLYEGRLYSMSDDGILTCVQAADGKTIWKKRLGGNFSSSPLIAGTHLYCSDEDGRTFVIDLENRGEVIAENKLSDGIMASAVVSGDRLLIRTVTGLFCLVAKTTAPVAEKPSAADNRL